MEPCQSKMIPGYAYKSILLTGRLHCVLGAVALITSIIALFSWPHQAKYYMTEIFVSLWILLVGYLGILASVKTRPHQAIWKFKFAYMIAGFLSAFVFCWLRLWIYVINGFSNPTALFLQIYDDNPIGNLIIFTCGRVKYFEFILAIVSSSICCCCSSTKQDTLIPHSRTNS